MKSTNSSVTLDRCPPTDTIFGFGLSFPICEISYFCSLGLPEDQR